MSVTAIIISIGSFLITTLLGIIAYFIHRLISNFDRITDKVEDIGKDVRAIKTELFALEKRTDLMERIVHSPKFKNGTR
ncbi:hypothetical protein KA025_02490 [Candidatus Saccharibacteria bacterium]|nr:hypothetical protein [Candidatus Saccharibacteria bacterium]